MKRYEKIMINSLALIFSTTCILILCLVIAWFTLLFKYNIL